VLPLWPLRNSVERALSDASIASSRECTFAVAAPFSRTSAARPSRSMAKLFAAARSR